MLSAVSEISLHVKGGSSRPYTRRPIRYFQRPLRPPTCGETNISVELLIRSAKRRRPYSVIASSEQANLFGRSLLRADGVGARSP